MKGYKKIVCRKTVLMDTSNIQVFTKGKTYFVASNGHAWKNDLDEVNSHWIGTPDVGCGFFNAHFKVKATQKKQRKTNAI